MVYENFVRVFFIIIAMKNLKKFLSRQSGVSIQDSPRREQAFRDRFSEWLLKKPFITIARIIGILFFIALIVRLILQPVEALAKSWNLWCMSLGGSIGNWFAFFGSYCGMIATVVLGLLTARLTIKQDHNKDYADISDLKLSDFCLYDLWRNYYPSAYGEERGRRFILAFKIEGLKTYYSIKKIKALWNPLMDDSTSYMCLTDLKTKLERTGDIKVKLCFNDFEGCDSKATFNYFFRLGCYEPKMKSPKERRCSFKLLLEVHYADGSSIRWVECKYCLEYTGTERGHVILTPKDHEIDIFSRSI